jgi:putative DNA-invertase from lambdoid prophage Rac
MLSVFADFERSTIQEMVRAGLLGARRDGKRLGRAPVKDALRQRIERVRKIATRFGVNASTVQAICQEMVVG